MNSLTLNLDSGPVALHPPSCPMGALLDVLVTVNRPTHVVSVRSKRNLYPARPLASLQARASVDSVDSVRHIHRAFNFD